MTPSERVRQHRLRQKLRGRHRLECWISDRAWGKLQELHIRGLDKNLGRTVERLLLRVRLPGVRNFMSAYLHALYIMHSRGDEDIGA